MIENGSFEDEWWDIATGYGYLTNQEPLDWSLEWIEPGQLLYDSQDVAGGVPECVHKLSAQLPPNEQLGAKNALILDGDRTYKIFHFGAPFGAELRQTVYGLEPHTTGLLIVPIQAHLHGDNDPYGAESGAWVKTTDSERSDDWAGNWANGEVMGDRQWYKHLVNFTVPPSGEVTVIIRVKSKWDGPKDFFIDGIRLEAMGVAVEPSVTAVVHVPIGYTGRVEGGEGREVVVRVPNGVQVHFVGADAG